MARYRKKGQTQVARFLRSHLGRYLIVGGSVFVLGGVLLSVLIATGIEKEWANLTQAVVSVELNFLLNYNFTWTDKTNKTTGQRVWRFVITWVKYHLGKLVTIPLNQLLFETWTNTYHVHYLFAYVLDVLLVMLVNYLIYEFFVFRKKNEPPVPPSVI